MHIGDSRKQGNWKVHKTSAHVQQVALALQEVAQ